MGKYLGVNPFLALLNRLPTMSPLVYHLLGRELTGHRSLHFLIVLPFFLFLLGQLPKL